MKELATCDMCVVEVSPEPENLRIKLAYYAEAVKLSGMSPTKAIRNYNYPYPTPDPKECHDLITLLLPKEMSHEVDIGDRVQITLSKEG